jgi:hypothetical protein
MPGGLRSIAPNVQPAGHQNHAELFPSLIVELSREKLTALYDAVMHMPRRHVMHSTTVG